MLSARTISRIPIRSQFVGNSPRLCGYFQRLPARSTQTALFGAPPLLLEKLLRNDAAQLSCIWNLGSTIPVLHRERFDDLLQSRLHFSPSLLVGARRQRVKLACMQFHSISEAIQASTHILHATPLSQGNQRASALTFASTQLPHHP